MKNFDVKKKLDCFKQNLYLLKAKVISMFFQCTKQKEQIFVYKCKG